MSTLRQKKLARVIIEDAKNEKPSQAKELLVSAGYDETTATASPGRTIEAKGVREELEKLGFSEEGAKMVVSEILYSEKAKDHDRLDAAEKVFKVHGSYAPEKHVNVNVEVEPSERIKNLATLLIKAQKGEINEKQEA